jgi:hypothetical protein
MPEWARSAASTIHGQRNWRPRFAPARRAALPVEKWAERVACANHMLTAVMQTKYRATIAEEANASREAGNADAG